MNWRLPLRLNASFEIDEMGSIIPHIALRLFKSINMSTKPDVLLVNLWHEIDENVVDLILNIPYV